MSNIILLHKLSKLSHAKNMKKLFFMSLFLSIMLLASNPVFVSTTLATNDEIVSKENTIEVPNNKDEQPKSALLAIVVDDFGGWDRSGVDELLQSNCPITCAILPFVDNSQTDYARAVENGKEVILHMPMQAHVNLPQSWYGPVYIENNDSGETAISKIEKCLQTMPKAKGFNVHIGSGAIKNLELMQALYEYSEKNNLPFLDSRTNLGDTCEQACANAHSIYLGRDVFLEPNKNKAYQSVLARLDEAANIAKDKGYAIAIGHVGPEGGVFTAQAIRDFCKKDNGVKIVPLSEIYEHIKNEQYK